MVIQFKTLDAETYYDSASGYSLRTLMTQEYIESPKAQEIMWAVGNTTDSIEDIQCEVGSADKLLNSIDWSNTCAVAHNAQFDGALLDAFHDIRPKRLFCTMAMAQTLGIQKITGSVSLSSLCKFFDLPIEKGTEVASADGKRLEDFSQRELEAYKLYNKKDVWLTSQLFNIFKRFIPRDELLWHSLVNKMYSEPKLTLDRNLLTEELHNIKERKKALIQDVYDLMSTSFDPNSDVALSYRRYLSKYGSIRTATAKFMNSNIMFAKLLVALNVDVPYKTSTTTGEDIYAFATSDFAFKNLMNHDNTLIRDFCRAKASIRSNMEEKRIERLILIASLPSGGFRIPHKISGAHTLRASGKDKINIQNLPSGRKVGQSKTGRRAITGFMGNQIAAPDSGQIEARILALISNDAEMLDVFASGSCPYSLMASKVYHLPSADIKKGDGLYKSTGDKKYKKYYMYRQTGKASVLQLGFAAGAEGFFTSLRDIYQVEGVSESECEKIHRIYAEQRPAVVNIWETCKRILETMVLGGHGYFGGADDKLFFYTSNYNCFGTKMPAIKLPNETWLTYPGLYNREGQDVAGNPTGWTEYAYFKDLNRYKRAIRAAHKKFDKDKGRKPTGIESMKIKRAVGYKQATRIWHGTVIENLCQALAFAVLKWQGVRIGEKVPNCFNVHDEFIVTSQKQHMEQVAEFAKKIMETTPKWLPPIKLECEYKIAENYGDS